MRIAVEDVMELVGSHFRLSKMELMSQSRHHYVSHPRQMAFLLCREFTDASLPRIAQRFGGKDHTTCLAGIRAVNRRIQSARNREELLSLARLRHLLEEKKNRDYDQAYALAWQTWAFIHRPQFMDRSRVAAE